MKGERQLAAIVMRWYRLAADKDASPNARMAAYREVMEACKAIAEQKP